MVTLYQYPCPFDLPNPSPPCMKVEGFLRFNNIPHRVKTIRNPGLSPSGRLPFIEHEGKKLAESSVILSYLKKTFFTSLDEHLTEAQRSLGHTLSRMCDHHWYWIGFYSRWVDPQGIAVTKKAFFGDLPALQRFILPKLVFRDMKSRCVKQGTALLPREQVYAEGIKDMEVIEEILGNKPFLFGEKLSSYDIVVFAYLAQIYVKEYDSPLKQAGIRSTTLHQYKDRMMQAWQQIT